MPFRVVMVRPGRISMAPARLQTHRAIDTCVSRQPRSSVPVVIIIIVRVCRTGVFHSEIRWWSEVNVER